ncbi:hypothetical protein O6H91_08G004800 [Diphasiastrum complanatum]|uniref:Uncharacterized protein n=1 Tax=Diphasiastrum complanatum TaxID=34168 RepID=A0ACC2CUB2_DIPCM|nr:hypothetical protein O6H91_Y257200 [Diphasiastrum complanatum]KAJ7545654.1 hypothetical protein O6H91_08G004800 [Diphasiastrum complanatum]
MAIGQVRWASTLVTVPGLIAFALGVIAENKKPADDAIKLIHMNGLTTCQYPMDSSIALGIFSIILLFASTAAAQAAIFFPYDGKHLPYHSLWKKQVFTAFFILSMVLYFTTEGLLIWATVIESNHRNYNIHHQALDSCPTAKTGLYGGAAFLALATTLFWLICMILVVNIRSDHLTEAEDETGFYGQVTADQYGPAMGGHYASKV